MKKIKNKIYLAIIFLGFFVGVGFSSYAISAESICPGGASPASGVVWCDDFENGAWPGGLSICTNNTSGFQDKCSAYSGPLNFDGYWGQDGRSVEKMLPSSYTELHLRAYVSFSNPYAWGDMTDKGIYLRSSSNDNIRMRMEYSRAPGYGIGGTGGLGKPSVASYAFSGGEVIYQNQGNDIIFQPGKWYLIEWYVKLNDPGVANGIIKLWIDDASQSITSQTLRLSYNSMLIRRSGNNSGYDLLWLVDYREDCRNDSGGCAQTLNQWVKWDNMVVRSGNNQIGPIGGGAPSPDTTPPSAPTGLVVV